MKLRLGDDPPIIAKKKRKKIIKFHDFAEIYFKEKETEVKDIEKIKKSYINHIKPYLVLGRKEFGQRAHSHLAT